MSCDSGGEEAWVGVGWDPPRPDRVPDILANFLEALRGEPRSYPWRDRLPVGFGHPRAACPVNCFYCYQMSLHPRQDFQRFLR